MSQITADKGSVRKMVLEVINACNGMLMQAPQAQYLDNIVERGLPRHHAAHLARAQFRIIPATIVHSTASNYSVWVCEGSFVINGTDAMPVLDKF